MQIRAAGELVVAGAVEFRDALIGRAFEHRDTVCVGRTHGIHAEPTSFGCDSRVRLRGRPKRAAAARRLRGLRGRQLSGAVGTYASLPRASSPRDGRLGIGVEDASPDRARDRHAELLSALALAGAGSSGSRPRSATCSERRSRGRGAVGKGRRAPRQCPTSAPITAERITAWPACSRLRAGGPRERRALARARHLPLGAERVISPTPHGPRLRAAPGDRVAAG